MAQPSRLEDESAIWQTFSQYAHGIDDRDRDLFVDCFTEDGVFEVIDVRTGQQLKRVAGREALTKFIDEHEGPPEDRPKHTVMNPLFNIDGDTATVKSHWIAYKDPSGIAFLSTYGRYLDMMQRGADGKWRFKHRLTHLEAANRNLPA